jgi:hypothetical protein
MASPDLYISSWDVGGSGPIPQNGFKKDSTLSIEQARACKLSWLDETDTPCSIESLRFDIPEQVVVVSFGPKSVVCLVRVESTDTGIKGTLTWKTDDDSDGNTGTFAADARTPPPVDAG